MLIKALEEIRDTAKSWEGRREAPYWNLGDKAAAALKRYNKSLNPTTIADAKKERVKMLPFGHEAMPYG